LKEDDLILNKKPQRIFYSNIWAWQEYVSVLTSFITLV